MLMDLLMEGYLMKMNCKSQIMMIHGYY